MPETGSVHKLACWLADRLTAFNRAPVTIITFTPACLAFIAIGWWVGHIDRALLILTTFLSIDASLAGRMNLLAVGKQAGEVE